MRLVLTDRPRLASWAGASKLGRFHVPFIG